MANRAKSKQNKAPQTPLREGAPAAGQLISMEEAIGALRTTRPTFYRLLRSGKLRGVKVGRQWRFDPKDIERFLKGEEPQFALPADIRPLLASLLEQFATLPNVNPPPETQSVVTRVANCIIVLAAARRASDIHIEPGQESARIRFRIDGALQPVADFDIKLLPALVARLKTMGSCDVNVKDRPQDARIRIKLENKDLDVRASFLPAFWGESVTMRILDVGNMSVSFDQLTRYGEADKARLVQALKAPYGLVVIGGPTGSGKTNTLYGCIGELVSVNRKVITIEDPVEYTLPGTTQTSVNRNTGMTFPNILRAILRSDPNVIVVGELRDRETIELALGACQTGHLVLTAMHCDEAAGVLNRLAQLGPDPYLIGDAIVLIVAQRLARKLCDACAEEYSPPDELLRRPLELAAAGGLDIESLKRNYRKPVGCSKCTHTGYRGRIPVVETMEMSPEIRMSLQNGAPTAELRAIAVRNGMTTIAADVMRHVIAGDTSLQEGTRILFPYLAR